MARNSAARRMHKPNKLDHLVNRYVAPLALLGGLAVILIATLYAFNFRFVPLNATRYFGRFLRYPSSILDFPLNVILFLPFGFGLASLLDQARLSKRATFLSVLLAGFLLTWLVETLQFFIPGRAPNVSDLAANTLGALVGLGCFRLWQNRPVVTNKLLSAISKPMVLLLIFATYLILLSGLGVLLRERARIINWRPNFPLLIGNEQTGSRSWAGNVQDLAILDRALATSAVQASFSSSDLLNDVGDSLVAYYPLGDPDSLADQTGNLPDLHWREYAAITSEDNIPQLDGRNWLKSASAVDYLAEKLQATSQFTLMLSLATADLEQKGPARIVSVSVSPFFRNLTVGQQGQDLIIRVRTPLTGTNGTSPEMKIPNFFIDKDPHKLIVTYDGLALTVYVDESKKAHRFDIVPGMALFYSFYGSFAGSARVNTTTSRVIMILFDLLLFIPVGIMLALLAARIPYGIRRFLLLLVGISLPPLLLELVLTARIGFDVRPAHLLLGSIVIAVTYLLLTPTARKLLGFR